MTNLGSLVRLLYPGARPTIDYLVADPGDGQGPRIVRWDATVLGPQPTTGQLAAAQLPLAQGLKCAAIDARTQQLIAAGFTFGGAQFGLSTTDQLNLTSLFSFSANLTFPLGYTTTGNGSFSIPDAATLKQMAGTALSAVRSALDSGRALKVQVLAATTTAGVDAVADTR